MELDIFFQYCDELERSKRYASYKKNDSIWTEEKKQKYQFGIIYGLYQESSQELLDLMHQPIDHKELIDLLIKWKRKDYNQEYSFISSEYYHMNNVEPREPLIQWIADFNYLLASPICNSVDELLSYPYPEQILSYVYISLKFRYRNESQPLLLCQKNIEELYEGRFDKSSDFKSWGLLPIDGTRKLYANCNPPRIYDKELEKTIFLFDSCGSWSIVRILEQLIDKKYIQKISFRGSDFYIYDGENCYSYLEEAVERGQLFSWKIDNLPRVTRLYRNCYYDDCLWIIVKGTDIVFEELCENFHDDGENIITQVIHIQRKGNLITHLDHEYVFYDIDQYDNRRLNPYVKGQSKRRVKTLKIDDAIIPMNYACNVIKNGEDAEIPIILFLLNNYFEHKDLLDEYFQKII